MYVSSSMIANVVASLSLLLSVLLGIFYLRDRRHAKYRIEKEYINELLQWHGEVVCTLSRLRIENREKRAEQCGGDLALLSALIEQGRFFFPNIDREDQFGEKKPTAYRGYRNLALDFLVASYNIFNSPEPANLLKQAETLQRHFTSVVFELVRPKHRLDKIRSLTDKYFVQEKSFEDFLDHHDSPAIEHIWRRD